MKLLRSIYALLALILVNMTFSRRTRGNCPCDANHYCDVGNKCQPKHKKGEACTLSTAQGGTSVENCAPGTSCKKNPVTGKLRCD